MKVKTISSQARQRPRTSAVNRERVLTEIGRVVASGEDIDGIYEQFARLVRTLLDADVLTINIVDPVRRSFITRYSSPLTDLATSRRSFALDGTVTGHVAATRQPVRINAGDYAEVIRRFPASVLPDSSLRSTLSVPLIHVGQVVGVLHLMSLQPGRFGDSDLKTALRIGIQISGSVAQSELIARLRRDARDTAVLNQLSRTVSESTRLEDVYEAARLVLQQLIPFARMSITQILPGTGRFEFGFVSGELPPRRNRGDILDLEGTVTGQLVDESHGIVVRSAVYGSVTLAAPLVSQGRFLGGLVLFPLPGYFSDAHLDLLETVANDCALAIGRVQDREVAQRGNADISAAEQWLRAIARNESEAVLGIGTDGRINMANQGAAYIIGRARTELVGLPFHALIAKAQDKQAARFLKRATQSPLTVEVFEARLQGQGQEIAHVEFRSGLRKAVDGDGVVVGVRANEGARVADRLPRAVERDFSRSANDAMPIFYLLRLRPNRGFQFIGGAIAAKTGRNPAAFYADPALGLQTVHPRDRSAQSRFIETLARGGEASPPAIRFLHVDGTIRRVEQRVVVLRGGDGVPIALAGIIQDVTVLARAETEREKALRRLQASESRLRVLSAEMVHAVEVERQRVTRVLHDDVGQSITAVKMGLRTLERRVAASERGRVADLAGLVEAVQSSLRDLAAEIRPPLIDELGLEAAIESFLERQAGAGGIQYRIAVRPRGLTLPPVASVLAFRVVQEAVTNAVKHSGAEVVEVTVSRRYSRIYLAVRDNGAGFDPSTVLAGSARSTSMGIALLRDRLELVGGVLRVRSRPGQGTVLSASFPEPATS